MAAYVTWMAKNPGWNLGVTHKRRLFLRELSESLVAEHLHRRRDNPQVMQAQVKQVELVSNQLYLLQGQRNKCCLEKVLRPLSSLM